MGVLERVFQQAGGDEAGRMGHVDHEDGANFVGYTAHAGIVPFARVGAGTSYNQFRVFFEGYALHLVVVHAAGFLIHIIAYGVEYQTREIHGAAVAQMAAVVEIHAHEGIAGFEYRHEHGHIGLRTRVGLHVDVFGIEELLEAFAGYGLGLVDHLTAAVVAVSRIALGIFVGQAGAHGLHHLG